MIAGRSVDKAKFIPPKLRRLCIVTPTRYLGAPLLLPRYYYSVVTGQ